MFELTTTSPEQTRSLGEALGQAAAPSDLFLLEGPFGSGKTVFIQGLAHGLGVPGVVCSPSFVMIAEHHGRVPFAHADFFRIEALDELLLGQMEDLLDGGLVVAVEWAERLPPRLRDGATHLRLSLADESTRQLQIATSEKRLAEAVAAWLSHGRLSQRTDRRR